MVAGMLTFTLLTLYLSVMIFYFGENIEYQFLSGFPQIAWSSLGAVFGGLNKMQYFSVGIIDIPTVFYQLVVTFYFLILASTQIDQVKK